MALSLTNQRRDVNDSQGSVIWHRRGQANSIASLDLIRVVASRCRSYANALLFERLFANDILAAPLTWHTLNSFIPIFELLGPKFVLDQNAYVSH